VVDDRQMQRAIDLAREWPHTHPNPRVGAVIVSSSGEIVGEGWHRGPGTDHAEIVALKQAGEAARGATAYISLEPCSHHGRTPPCADALISAGVATVVAAVIDPDRHVSGEGFRRLEDAGVEVITGTLSAQARRVDPAYFQHRETGLAMVTIKWAMTLDGSIAASDGSSRWITGEEARADVHELRSMVDGVVVGAGTLRADDPRLDVRLPSFSGPQPRAVVVAGAGDLPAEAQIWERDPIIVSTTAREVPAGQVIEVPGRAGLPDPIETCRILAEHGLLALLLEGGPGLAAAWWRAGVITDGHVYVAGLIGGGAGLPPIAGVFETIGDARDVELRAVRSVGQDVVISFEKRP
jgi:diaminohydroxyphosphoribosylaminopyrimidine deaminase/5-amino-6-(5-phosphoribosylamino)uracil reductase